MHVAGKQDPVAAMDKLLHTLDEAEAKARRNARLVHAVNWAEAQVWSSVTSA